MNNKKTELKRSSNREQSLNALFLLSDAPIDAPVAAAVFGFPGLAVYTNCHPEMKGD